MRHGSLARHELAAYFIFGDPTYEKLCDGNVSPSAPLFCLILLHASNRIGIVQETGNITSYVASRSSQDYDTDH